MNPLLDLAAHPVIAHRGASGLAPENTREALELAVTQGADALEVDVHLASCGTPVVLHDPTLERTTGTSGRVCDRSAAELAGLDAGFRFTLDGGRSYPWRERGLGIPSLAEVLERFPTLPLLVELKTVDVAVPVVDLVRRHGAEDRVVVASFLDAALVPLRVLGLQTGASRRGILQLWLRSKVGSGGPQGPDRCYAVPLRYREAVTVPTPRFVRAARAAGRPVHVWTVNDPREAVALWERGVSGIITNFPALMVAERGRHFEEWAG